jgi:hypothetical protein
MKNQDNKTKLSPAELLERHRYKGKLTPMFRERAIAMVKGGSPPKTALKALGVADSTIRLWDMEPEDGVHQVFKRELLGAEQLWLTRMAENATRLSERDGRVCVDILGRRDSEHWGRKDVVEVDIDIGPKLAEIAARVSQIQDADWLALEEPCNTQSHPNEGGITDGGTERVIPSV